MTIARRKNNTYTDNMTQCPKNPKMSLNELIQAAKSYKPTLDDIQALRGRLAAAELRFLASQKPLDLEFRYTI